MLKLRVASMFIQLMAFAIPLSKTCAQQLTLDDIFFSGKYSSLGSNQFRFPNTSSDYTQLNTGENGQPILESFDIVSGKKSATIFDAGKIGPWLQIDDYFFSSDDKMILLDTESEDIYRHSTRSYFYIYDTESSVLIPLNEEVKQMCPHFSPDNGKVGYIVDNNLFYRDLNSGKNHQITFDGKVDHIINGRPDWVYEEEFTIERMYEWSEDGSKMLFAQFDESDVPEFSFMRFDGSYPTTETFKYPRAGENNSKVILKMYDAIKDTLALLDIPYEYEYIPRIIPAGNGFAFMLLNRHQNLQRIVFYDPGTDSFSLVFESESAEYVNEPTVFEYVGSGKYVLANDRDGWLHLYIVAAGETSQVTTGRFETDLFYGIDENGWMYYRSSEKGPSQRHIFKKNIHTGEEKLLASDPGIHEAAFSGNLAYFVHTWSSQGVPPVISVRDNEGALVRIIEDNRELRRRLGDFWSDKEFFEINAGGYSIPAWMIKPPGFDAKKKYPVLNYIYGGPGSQNVLDEYGGAMDLWFQMLAQMGYVIVSADNRGMPGKGSEYLKANYLRLGTLEVEDQLIVIDYLKALPYIDGSRIGYFGWSYGGYMALMMLFKGSDMVKAALSVAPVTHWKFYDTIYTERFMRTPQENPEGYREGSPVNFVSEWNRGSLFLAHGTTDDNVHFQNTTELIKEMSRNGKHYDLYIYPDGAHGMGSYRNYVHLFEKMTSFVLEKL